MTRQKNGTDEKFKSASSYIYTFCLHKLLVEEDIRSNGRNSSAEFDELEVVCPVISMYLRKGWTYFSLFGSIRVAIDQLFLHIKGQAHVII